MSTQRPEVRPNNEYTKYERLLLALAHYHADLQKHFNDPEDVKKPIILQFTKLYDVPETTLRRHIRNPGQRTQKELHEDQQLLTVAEEKVLVERLLFLDDFNIPASRDQLYELAHTILHRRDPDRTISRDWIYRFLARHEECRYVVVKAIATNRANSISWDMVDDFFGKRETVLAELKQIRDDKEAEEEANRQIKEDEKRRKEEEKVRKEEEKEKKKEERLKKAEEREVERERKAMERLRLEEERERLAEEREREGSNG